MADIIYARKDAHLDICRRQDIEYRQGAGFEDVAMVHDALPELDLKKVDIATSFLGKRLAAPLLITGMTGGTPKGGEINQALAAAAEETGVALGLGSQRPMLKDAAAGAHYKVRALCPSIPLIGNVGAVNLVEYPLERIEGLVAATEADALAIHLNALQEAIQPEGDTDFSGVLSRIAKVCERLDVPVIAKETGAGLNASAAARLVEAGVSYIDVSGRGGTSWSKVEYARGGRLAGFEEWGYPTVPAIAECAALLAAKEASRPGAQAGRPKRKAVGAAGRGLIATGGLRDGLDAAKAIALGADIAGAALPFLKAPKPAEEVRRWMEQMRTAMFLSGSKDIAALRTAPLLIDGPSARVLRLRGIDPAAYAQRAAPAAKPSTGPKEPDRYYI